MYMSSQDLKSLAAAEIKTLPDNVIIGDSDGAHAMRQMAALAAGTTSPVLLTGPAGSGKNVAARAVHAASARRNGAFVSVDCSALTDDDASHLLFGITGGSKAAAAKQKALYDTARGGTLFLDEVGDLPLDAQAILEELLEDENGAVPGMAVTAGHRPDARIITASSQCLASQIGDDLFRQDIYYNLSLLTIPVPPLRQRREDISILIDYFQMDKPLAERFTLDRAAMQLLHAHYWPGNVRELRNLVARACLFHPGRPIGARRMGALLNMGQPMRSAVGSAADTAPDIAPITPGFNLKAYLDDEEMRFIESALVQAEGVVQHAADLSGLKRTTFIEKMKRHGISRSNFRK